MTNALVTAAVLLLSGTAVQPVFAQAQVPDTVHIAPPTGETDTDRASILAAFARARPGGTVLFAPGTYLVGELIRLETPRLTLLGHPEGTVLRGCHPEEYEANEREALRTTDAETGWRLLSGCGMLELTGGHVTVRNLTFEHSRLGLILGCCEGEDVLRSAEGGYRIEANTFRNSGNSIRAILSSPEPTVIRGNRFINTFHALSGGVRHVHMLDNEIAVPEPGKVPGAGHPGFAIGIRPPYAGPANVHPDGVSACEHNIIAGNRIMGHTDGILLRALPGTRCGDNTVRGNRIEVRRAPIPDDWVYADVVPLPAPGDSTLVGVPLALVNIPARSGSAAEDGEEGRLEDNLVEGNRIVGADGLGIEVLGASRNRIVSNTITGVRRRDPFPGNTTGGFQGWAEANGSGIWISPGSDDNEIVGNTFDDVEAFAVFLEGDDNRVELRSAADLVKDLGNGNRVTVRSVMEPAGSRDCRQPPKLDDGWTTAAPAGLGLACAPLVEMTEAIRRDDYRNVHAVLVAKDGRLVYEEYFTGTDRRPESSDYSATVTHNFDRNTLHTTRSAGKSFTSALVGVALASGAISSVEQPVLEFLSELADVADPAAREITLEHLLTMSAGFDWNEGDVPYTNPANHERALSESDDPARFVLSREVVAEPGSRWDYNSGLPTLLGLVVHRATGQAFGTYAREHLFAPLGIKRVDWTGPPAWADHPAFIWDGDEPWRMTRSTQPAGSLWLRPRDMLKFGQLYQGGGRWNGRQVLPENWVAASLEPRVPRSKRPSAYPNGAVRHAAYGYQWWYDRFELPYGKVTVHSASGNGGQKIWVLPELGLAAVHLAGNYNVPGSGWEAERLLLERIVPWAMGVRTDYRHQPSLAPVAVDPEQWPLAMLPDTERARYPGSYRLDGQSIEIRELDGRLQLLPPIAMGPLDLVPQGDHVFVLGLVEDGEVHHIFTPEERYVFVFDDDGRVVRFEITGPDGVTGIGERVR